MHIEEKIHAAFTRSGQTLALAESCTGGAIAAALTRLPGASQFFLGSMVVYSPKWKETFLGVSTRNGAVSAEVVEEMVRALFERTECVWAAAITGIAGPTGGTPELAVGTMFIAVGKRGEAVSVHRIEAPSPRARAIDFAVQRTLELLLERVL